MSTIEATLLTKDYRYYEKEAGLRGSLKALFKREMQSRRALDDFSFTLEPGEFVGLMGPNGAGKTTLVKLLAGIIRPTAGSARVLGHDPSRSEDAFKQKIAVVMGQKSQLWWDLPAVDSLLLNKALYGVSEARYRENVAMLSGIFAVEHLLNVPVRQLSLGERMKLEIIASLLHDPQMLFLDEPTIGLDATAQRQIREMLREAGQKRGISILLTSHYTEDLLRLTPRVMVIREGHKVYDGSLEALLRKHSEARTVTVRFSTETHEIPVNGFEVLVQDPYNLTVRVPNEQVQVLLRAILDTGAVEDIQVDDEEIGLLVERVYQREARA